MLPASRAVVGLRSVPDAPAVSVIIPTFNRASLVTQAVESVLAQTVRDFEIIVVDDGSTDGTVQALEPYLSEIRYIRQANRGIAGARNRGIEEARGEFLAFLDSDDRFEPRMLEVVLETFKQYPAAGSVATAEREIDSWNRRGTRVFTKRSAGAYFSPETLVGTDTRIGCGRPAVVRRRWVEQLGGFDEEIRCAVDCDLWIRYSFHMPIVLQPEPLVLRRTHGANLSRNRKQDALDWLRILEKLADDHPDFVEKHEGTYRRALAKNYLRYGRELLAEEDLDTAKLGEARRALRRACELAPFRARAHVYFLWSYLAPSTYQRFRRWELDHIERRT
jgi:glycosyltransferase involved in cell wall biosynthesis